MSVQFIIAGGYAANLLEAAEQPLDGVVQGVAGRVEGARVATLAAGRNHCLGAAVSQGGHQRAGIVAAVGNEMGRGQALEQGLGLRGVVALARVEAAAHGPAAGVGYRVPLGR